MELWQTIILAYPQVRPIPLVPLSQQSIKREWVSWSILDTFWMKIVILDLQQIQNLKK